MTTQSALVRTSMAAGAVCVTPVDQPQITADSILVDIELCGLCGSDQHILNGDPGYDLVKPGQVLGHEVVGLISAVGQEVDGETHRIGDRVVVMSQTGCGECEACARDYANACAQKIRIGLTHPGGATGTMRVKPNQLVSVPTHLSARTAVLAEPASIAAHAADRGRIDARSRVVVSGPGTVGILAALICRARGAAVTMIGTSMDRQRESLVASLGLPLVTSTTEIGEVTHWIEASGAGTALRTAMDLLPTRGTLVVVGIYSNDPALPMTSAVRKELDLTLSYGSSRKHYVAALSMLAHFPSLGESFVDTVDIEHAVDALAALGSTIAPKTAVQPNFTI